MSAYDANRNPSLKVALLTYLDRQDTKEAVVEKMSEKLPGADAKGSSQERLSSCYCN